MIVEQKIIVTIGSQTSIVSLHGNNQIKEKIYIETLNDESKKQLKEFFSKNKISEIFIILDGIDQIYKKKSYPTMQKGDVLHLIKREITNDPDKDAIKNFLLFEKKKIKKIPPKQQNGKIKEKIEKSWDCMFISFSNSEFLTNWIEFLLSMPNHLRGIYMLSVEAFELSTAIIKQKNKEIDKQPGKNKKDEKKQPNKGHKEQQENLEEANGINKQVDKKLLKKEEELKLYCFIVKSKVSGTRQIVFSENGIVFTRAVSYEKDKNDFAEKYYQDIFSTFDYLKRIYPELQIEQLEIVNILSKEHNEKIKNSNNELAISSFTPAGFSEIFCYKNLIEEDEENSDLLIAQIFSKSKPILKFSTPKILATDRLFLILKSFYYINLVGLVAILLSLVIVILFEKSMLDLVEEATQKKELAFKKLSKVKKNTFNGDEIIENNEPVSIDRISDFGKFEEYLKTDYENFEKFYKDLKFLKKFDATLEGFSYNSPTIDIKTPKSNNEYKIVFFGKMLNRNGDIEQLFSSFDALTAEVKNNFANHKVKYVELPRDIDFAKKYYDTKIQFSIQKN